MSVIIVVVETEKPADDGELLTAKAVVSMVLGDAFGGVKWAHVTYCDEEQSAALREELAPARPARLGGGQ